MSEERGVRFDALVDTTVREMLDVEPSFTFPATSFLLNRGRPERRTLGAASWKRVAGNWKLAAGSVAVAAAMVLVALWLPTRSLPSVTVPVPQHVQVVEPTAAQRLPFRVTPQKVTRVAVRSQQSTMHTLMPPSGAASSPEMPPLRQIAPIHVASVTTPSIAPKEIAIEPLAPIAEVEIAPLNPPDRRN